MAQERLLIVGNGMAGLKLCEELVARGAGTDITVCRRRAGARLQSRASLSPTGR